MPNTEPPLDDAAVVAAVLEPGAPVGRATSHVAGCITHGPGRHASSRRWASCTTLGVRVFTDDGACVADAGVMRRALEYARCAAGRGDRAARRGRRRSSPAGTCTKGSGRAGSASPAGPRDAEAAIVARDLALAELTGARVHFLHLSTAGAVDAGARGQAPRAAGHRARPRRTTSRSPTRRAPRFDPVFKVQPAAALRRRRRRAHGRRSPTGPSTRSRPTTRPHAPETKERPFEEAPPGMLGLETALALTLTELVEPGVLSLAAALALLSWQPGADRRARRRPRRPDRGRHGRANLCVIDPARPWVVDPARLASRARNTPVRRPEAHAAGSATPSSRGEPVVVDGEAQR